MRHSYLLFAMLIISIVAFAVPQDDKTKKTEVKAQPKIEQEAELGDSATKTRWKVQKTVPLTEDDLSQGAADLKRPENLKQEAQYNDTLGYYIFGNKIGGTYVDAPVLMTPDEFMKWSEKKLLGNLFYKKNAEAFDKDGKEKFDFTDMHFNLGPAEKIFGPGGVRVTTQGTAEMKFGMNMKNIQNPSLPISRRKTTGMDFDMKINMSMQAKVGDKVNMNLNYNTDATFNYDAQNMKLKYEGKEDEVIKLVEGGNVTFPSNSSLIKGASSLFGIRTDLQFGKLKLQTVVSQKKSTSKSVSSKGGVQLTPFEMDVNGYDANRHFFLGHYFHDRYDGWMKTLPTITSGITINRIEIWVTNTSGNSNNSRNIIALTDLAEPEKISKPHMWVTTGINVPSNAANDEYRMLVSNYADARNIDQTSTVLDAAGMEGGVDYEKLEKARLLTSSEYTLNQSLGYVTLNATLKTDQVLAVAYEYTYGGQTFQVGEFASDITETSQALFVKSLKNASNNPEQGNWRLMMKNVYKLATQLQKEKFRLDVKYQSDTTGVYISHIPEQQVKSQTIIRLLGADRLDNNNKPNPNGYFDYVEGYTATKGCIFFPCAEPFGQALIDKLTANGVSRDVAEKYAFTELYDSTHTTAKQIAEKDKFILTGQYKGSKENVISLGGYNIPQGSVVVTAGGMTLTEGTDYTVDYSAGEVTILNKSIIDAGTNISVSSESNTDYGMTRKTMLGMNWAYDFTKDFQLSGTIQHLSEQALTNKVAMGSEPLNNTLWGLNVNWKKEVQWLTKALNAIPLLHVSQPSTISFQGEFAHLIAAKSRNTQDNASYIDDFDDTKKTIDVSTPSSWIISSVPVGIKDYDDKQTLKSGFRRAKLAWYTIDPLFTRLSSSLTPSHIKSDLDQLSNHYVREVYVNELFPNRDQSSYNGATNTLQILNLAYYPTERGPYNFNPDLETDGTLRSTAQNPTADNWGGMMRKLDTSDFETANVGYIEFWMMDPFIYSRRENKQDEYKGELVFNLGDISEDVLLDGKKFYESGMPVDGSESYATTQWGKVPTQATVTYAFATTAGSREKQDVGFNGLTDAEERVFSTYQDFLSKAQTAVSGDAWAKIQNDPAADNYHYFRGSDYDDAQTSIMERYKNINNPQGNSPDSSKNSDGYDTSYKTTPDVEDINQDYTLNEYDKYYEYRVSISDRDLQVGDNYVVDKRVTSPKLRNGKQEEVTWYKLRIPVEDWTKKYGSISDFSSIRFMRIYMTGFEKPVVLRFGTMDLVRGDWRIYNQNLDLKGGSGSIEVSAVNIEENVDKTPVNYTLPPGIRREQDPSQPQLVENNEQSLQITVENLNPGESKSVYKTSSLDLRQYKRLQLFVHANATEQNLTNLQDDQLALFVRLGSDYKSNFYEYEIPLKLTPEGHYDQYSNTECRKVWPEENMLNISTDILTKAKKNRNLAKSRGEASYTEAYVEYDDNRPNNKITVMGNPSLGEVKTMMIGVRNKSGDNKSGEIWVNELRMLEYDNSGGWAAQGNLNVQMSDLGTVNLQGKYMTAGFGGLEDGVAARSQEDYGTYTVTTQVEMGKFFPEKAKVSVPVYFSLNKEKSSPKYNPLDTDMLTKDALEAAGSKADKDSLSSIVVTRTTNRNFSVSNAKVGIQNKKHPTPIDPANFSFTYSHSHKKTTGETTVYETEDNWKGGINYSWTPVIKAFEPWKKSKTKSKWMDLPKQMSFNWLPQNISMGTDMTRSYYELQERDMESTDMNQLPLTFSKQFMWNRDFSIRWDFTKNIHMNFSSATHAEVEEPYTPVNKSLYPDEYSAWKDSVWTSIKHLGTPLDYSQNFSLQVQSPLDKLPILDWTKADASFKSNYSWVRGTTLEDGTNLGNTVSNSREISLNGTINFEKLYNHVPFLKKVNDELNKDSRKDIKSRKTDNGRMQKKPDGKLTPEKQALNTKKKGFEKEITLTKDSVLTVNHGKKSKKLVVTARTEDGKLFNIKYKVKDENTIAITNKVDSTLKLKIAVTTKPGPEESKWYKPMQVTARLLMMVRSLSISYRNKNAVSLPGFLPMAGSAFGQKKDNGLLAPGLGFAFGLQGEEFIEKARENNWLLCSDSVATPATTSHTEDLQLKMTLEPWKNFKIDLNATRVDTRNKSIQYMYEGVPTSQSGTFNMTTISLKSAFEGGGSADNGYYSKSFEKFCNSIASYRERVEAGYKGSVYPKGTALAGQTFDARNGGVGKYSSDVLIPAFLSSYTNMKDGLSIFPSPSRLLPNWSMKFSGIGKLPWVRDHFKSVNLNHAYKSVYAVGSYSSYSTFVEYMDGRGFITDATSGNPVPSSMYNVSTVSINESFSPLAGLDLTFNNNITLKCEYKTTRVLTLSTTSVQLNESTSKDWVVGCGYKIQDLRIGSRSKNRKVKGAGKKGAGNADDSNGENANSGKSRKKQSSDGVNHDLNLRFDFTFRNQAAITRDIQSMTSAASSGNKAVKFSFNADYTVSKLLTMSFYYDRQINTPLLSSSSYPTTTQDFGLSVKFSLRR